MKPIKNKKRIDPRYFLNETAVNKPDKLQELGPPAPAGKGVDPAVENARKIRLQKITEYFDQAARFAGTAKDAIAKGDIKRAASLTGAMHHILRSMSGLWRALGHDVGAPELQSAVNHEEGEVVR